MTSLDVIREVMNVPMEAIHAIARMNGISTADDHEQTITESELRPFTEAFERKTRNYFINSMRNRAQLTPQELQTFTEFCKTFKKGNVSLDNVSNWNHIGKTKLRQYFVERIKEKTPSIQTHHTELDLFCGCGGFDAIMNNVVSEINEPTCSAPSIAILKACQMAFGSEFTEYLRSELENIPLELVVMQQVTSSWQYARGIANVTCYSADIPDIIHWIILSARYYIYIDDDDDHLSDTISVNGHNDLIINSTYRMVA